MAKRHYSAREQVADLSPRTQAMQDDYMIHSDFTKIANLPQEVMMKSYERTGPMMPENLDDTISGIDRQIDADDRKRASHMRPQPNPN